MPQKFNLGPGIYRKEIDVSEVTSPVGTSTGALVGKASQGIVNCRTLITRDKELVDVFGEPAENLGYGLYGALEFLKESDRLYFVRVTSGGFETYSHAAFTTSGSGVWKTITANASTTLLQATGFEDGNTPTSIKDINDYSFSGEIFAIASIGPGSYGNNLAVSIVTCADNVSAGFDWQNRYDSNPLTDLNAKWRKVFKINVYKKPENALGFNSVSASPVETFYVSRESISDDNGNNLYLETVINGVSKYIYVKDNAAVANTTYPGRSGGLVQLLSGADNTSVPQSEFQSGWSLFNDKEKVDVNILVCTEPGTTANTTTYATQQVVGNIAASRKDCIALMQVDGTSSTTTNATTIVNNAGYGFNDPSYVALYAGWELVYDKYNNRNLYIPENIFGAALMARTDAIANTWDAPAGITRGRISSLGQNVIWNGSQIGFLGDANINVSKFVRGQNAHFMYGQKTALRKASALSDINVRRLLLYVENSIENSLHPFIFESNTDKTRLRVKSILDSFLGQVAAGGGFNTDEDAGFLVVCDSSNNTAQVINNNQLVVDLYVKPSRSILYIQLNTIISKSGISFEELIAG